MCKEDTPERWQSEVRFNGTTILRAETSDSCDPAFRRAEELLNARVTAA